MAQRVGVVVFPGTNCEHDVVEAFEGLGGEAELVWHAATSLSALRCGRTAWRLRTWRLPAPGSDRPVFPGHGAPSASFAAAGGPVVGICNGFQVLTEAHLLPGALQKNKGLTFLCQMTELEVVSDRSALTAGVEVGRRLRVPINHFEGNYTAASRRSVPWRPKEGLCCVMSGTPMGRSTTSPLFATSVATSSG